MTMAEYKARIESALDRLLPEVPEDWNGLRQAQRYSLLAGGKRIRPMLTLEFCRVCGGDVDKALPVGCAVEMVHTYSLIHDDLPCMDNDTLRRGKPTNHVVYGECNATLAGDALQADAFTTLLSADLPAGHRARCAALLAHAAGSAGMCAGQYLDTAAEGLPVTETQLRQIHALKTGAMIVAACQMGVAAAGGTEEQMAAAEVYGSALGLAFQIRDDVLDETASVEELGKPIGSDKQEGKTTFVSLFGVEQCREMVDALTKRAIAALEVFDDPAFLHQLALTLAERNY